MRRTVIPELLDSDAGTSAEIAGSLADLRFFNRYFGGSATMTEMLRKVAARAGKKQLTFLDVAGASGDVALAAQRELAKSGVGLQPILLDRAASHLANGFAGVAGDAFQLPFPDSSIDCVGCSLFAHHLEPDEVVRFVNEALRVARDAVLINDLRRHPAHFALAYAGKAIYRSRLTRHDAPASVRRAHTMEEMGEYLRQSTAARVEITSHYLFRLAAIAWKHE
jgi:ubiquinone/menaquinone biosynthesis C-methylase UbiE